MWTLKNKRNKTETDTENKLVVTRGEEQDEISEGD